MVSKIHDISSSGFSIIVDAENDGLFCGLIIRKIRLETSGDVLATVTAQVVHRSLKEDENGTPGVLCGFTILDMAVSDHTRLHKLLQQVEDPNAYLNSSVEQDALWEFFFETGFIYPEKYCSLRA